VPHPGAARHKTRPSAFREWTLYRRILLQLARNLPGLGLHLLLKILFIVAYAPTLIRTRSLNLIKALAANGNAVALATLCSDKKELSAIQPLAAILEDLIVERIHSTRSFWNCTRALPGSEPLQANYSWSPRLAKRIIRTVQTKDFDVVHIEHLRSARYAVLLNDPKLLHGRKHLPLIWDSVDCISDLYRYASQNSYAFRWRLITKIELPRTEKYEGRLANQFDRVLVTSESDKRGLTKLAEKWRGRNRFGPVDSIQERIAVVPNGVDLAYFTPTYESREPQTLVITGKMSYHANITAVARFVKNVMPRIWMELPRTKLRVVGRNPPPEIRKLGVYSAVDPGGPSAGDSGSDPRVEITGTVKDIRPFLRKATLAVAPIRYGAGIQNKVLEAMACGTPVVATSEAVRALHAEPERDVIVADGEQQLADSIISMLKNPGLCSSIGSAGRAYVEKNHDWRLVARQLAGIYRNAGDQNSKL
jgi:glycosyltransferase involved in cell wall biosynthesis